MFPHFLQSLSPALLGHRERILLSANTNNSKMNRCVLFAISVIKQLFFNSRVKLNAVFTVPDMRDIFFLSGLTR